jgi:hypothetical protein
MIGVVVIGAGQQACSQLVRLVSQVDPWRANPSGVEMPSKH